MEEQIYLHRDAFFKKLQGAVILYNVYNYEGRLKMHIVVSRLLESIDGNRTLDGIVKLFDEQSEIFGSVKGFNAQNVMKYLLDNGFLTLDKDKGKLPQLEQKYPAIDMVNLRVTNSCNFSCSHCFPESSIQKNKELTYEELIDVISELAKYKVLHITLTGGEPFLNNNLLDIAEFANSKGMIVSICTNASLIKDEHISRLKKCAIGSLKVSLDGASAETHDQYRGNGKFEKLIPMIRKLVDAKIYVCINTVISKINFHEYKQISELVKELKVSEFACDTIRKTGRALENWDILALTYEEKLEFTAYFRSLMPKFGDVVIGSRIFPLILNDTIETDHLTKACGLCISNMVILSNGDVTPCWRLFDLGMVSGNIKQSSLDDIWNKSELFIKVRNLEISSLEKCKDCEGKDFCEGSCRAFALANHNNWSGEPDPERCRFALDLNSILLVK